MKTSSSVPVKKKPQKQANVISKKFKPAIAKELRSLFIDEMKNIYCAEKVITKAIPAMIGNATADELVEVLTTHLDVTRQHVIRLEIVFTSLGEKAMASNCEAMTGLVKDAEKIMNDTEAGMVRDACIIASAQKVEHYEIASYGTLCSFAKTLGEFGAATLFQETLDEEKETDEKLSAIAESFINAEAAGLDQDLDEEGDIDSSGIMVKYKRR